MREVDVGVSVVLLAAVAGDIISPELDKASIHPFSLRDFPQGVDAIVDTPWKSSWRRDMSEVLLSSYTRCDAQTDLQN